jgi:hypothetical protein
MSKTNKNQCEDPIGFIEEKGDVEHAIRCTEQALQRAEAPWLKQACAFRVKMLQIQLARQKKIKSKF